MAHLITTKVTDRQSDLIKVYVTSLLTIVGKEQMLRRYIII